MSIIMEKDEAHRIIDRMPLNATWDDLMREIYVREAELSAGWPTAKQTGPRT